MNRIVAVTGRPPSAPVTEVAEALGAALGAAAVSRVGGARHNGLTAETVLRELERPGVLLTVLARDDRPNGSAWSIASRAGKPVVLVPPDRAAARIGRVLVPLDGTAESAAAVRETMRLFAEAGVELVVLHVFDAVTTPAFWDQAAHARQTWQQEFQARFCAPVDVRVELRNGEAGRHVIEVADDERVDLIALGWSQRLGAGHARTVRDIVRDATVPVMLVPWSPPTGT